MKLTFVTFVTSALLGLVLPLASCQDSQAAGSSPAGSAALTPEILSNLNQGQLDAIFHAAPPGPIPDGNAQGTAVRKTLRNICLLASLTITK
jgi:hypothetical protein